MNNLLRLYYFICATLGLFSTFGFAAWQFRGSAARSLDLPEGLAMGAKEKRRLKHYFYGTTYLAALMCCLRNQSRNRREKHLFTNLSALAYSFDDLVDVFQDDALNVLWKDNPEDYGLANDQRGLALHLLHNIYRELPEQDLGQFRAYMHQVFNLETTGRQRGQMFSPTEASKYPAEVGNKYSPERQVMELEKITAEKGGYSVLLFRSVLSHPLTEEEKNALYQFGYLIQCCDDIFDLWHDRQAGIITLPTCLAERNEIGLLIKIFEQQVNATQQAFRQTSYSSAQVETALSIIHYLVSITRVCLRHYSDLKRKYGTLPLDDRTTIVVDMERWTNRFRAIRYLLRPL